MRGVNGRGFHRLAELDNLEVLLVTFTPVRDEALLKIKGLKGLTYVSVHGCRHLSPDGVADFRTAVPKCEVRGFRKPRTSE